LKLPKVKFSPYVPQQFHGEFHEHHHLWPHQIPQGANVDAIGLIVREMGETKMGTKNLDWGKAGLEMTLISSIFLAFLHAFSNVIQSRQILQIIEQLSFKFHQGQKKTQACPNHLNSSMCTHLNHWTKNHIDLQIESRKGSNFNETRKCQNKQIKK
jgi:hypothetical protein